MGVSIYPQSKTKNKSKEGKRNICCNCKKSHCLKLYCDCFSRGFVCEGCNCINCKNNVPNHPDRLKIMELMKAKRSDIFMPKIANREVFK
jgi:protein lin-54